MSPTRHRERVRTRLKAHTDERFQHELKEMQETQDLREIDDDVETVATLYEWYAEEHNHRPKSPRWFMVLAAATTLLAGFFLVLANFTGALSIAAFGGFLYYLAQRQPDTVRYRLMVDGIAFNNTLYHYKDLQDFNVIYHPGETKSVLFHSKRHFSPLLHMEIGEADPIAIRDILLEFLPENQDLEEPIVDIWARRLGF